MRFGAAAWLGAVLVTGWAGASGAQTCEPSATTMCLLGGRFEVTADFSGGGSSDFTVPDGRVAGQGTALDLGLDDTGAFGLTDPEAPDLIVKLLDGTVINGHFWVFAAGTTDLEVSLTVTDTVRDVTVVYRNPLGTAFAAVQDTQAFPEPPLAAPSGDSAPPIVGGSSAKSVLMSSSLLLADGRMKIDAVWRTNDLTGSGQPVEYSESAGFFWFFNQDNLELLVRVVDGGPINGSPWVLVAGLSNVQMTLTVTDLETGRVATYFNPLFTPVTTVLDDDPFRTIDDGVRVASLGAVRAPGLEGSDWHDRQLIRATSTGTAATLYLTPRDQRFDAMADPSLRLDLDPGEVLILEDLFDQLLPGTAGAGTLRLVPDRGTTAPIWSSWVYNQTADGELGMVTAAFDVDGDGWYGRGTTLTAVLSPDGYRDNIDPTTGPSGVDGEWTYTDSSGAEVVTVHAYYPPDTTRQFSVASLIGFEPQPGATLAYHVTGGSVRIFLSRNNNGTNDPARDELVP